MDHNADNRIMYRIGTDAMRLEFKVEYSYGHTDISKRKIDLLQSVDKFTWEVGKSSRLRNQIKEHPTLKE
ncbi:hypothetical protein KEJ51_01245 [Candidatus Bathyarchaeota archaeon]|nr:hypothetical protein [Candidatus Bathyarchaeota archaeon]MBS7628463.1 hypothetical protein [Candidatus Bathyarchaeota archaeon]